MVRTLYQGKELRVERINVDNESACIKHDIRPTTLNLVVTEEHVGVIDGSIRVVKERTRCHVH